jgi:hypothetical protein
MYSSRKNKAISTILTIAIIVIIVAAVVVTATVIIVLSPGNQKTQTYSFTDFTALNVGSAFKVNITQSNTYSVTITAGENLLKQIEVTQNGNTLTIDVKPSINFGIFKAEAQITMPKLDNIVLSGATRGTAQGFSSEDPFGAEISGASSLEITNFQAGNVTTNISGASTFTATGSANDLTSIVSGASHLNLLNLAVNNANMDISGASQATINAHGRLDANLSGASHLEYTGSPTLGTINTSGASSISKK